MKSIPPKFHLLEQETKWDWRCCCPALRRSQNVLCEVLTAPAFVTNESLSEADAEPGTCLDFSVVQQIPSVPLRACGWGGSHVMVHLTSFDGLSEMVKNLHANAGDIRDVCLIPGSGGSPGGGCGNTLQCSCLGNSMDRGAWHVHRSNSQTQPKPLSTHSMHTITFLVFLHPPWFWASVSPLFWLQETEAQRFINLSPNHLGRKLYPDSVVHDVAPSPYCYCMHSSSMIQSCIYSAK